MRVRVALAALLLLTIWTYRGVWTAEFVYEDTNAVSQNPSVTGQSAIAINRARWVSALSHRLVFTTFGPSPRASHLANLALHLGNGLLVFFLLRSWVSPWAAMLACGVFWLHPLQTEAVAYVASRSELLSTAFVLLACVLAANATRWWQHLAVWGCVAVAVCAKESAAVVVPLLAVLDLARGRRLSLVRVACLALPLMGIAYTVFRFDHIAVSDLSPLDYAATQATALWRYLALVVVPLGQTVDHDYDLVPWAVRWLALAGVWALIAFPVLAGLSFVDGDTKATGRLWDGSSTLRVCALGVTWLLVALAPRFVMRIPELMNEHHMYLPFIGVWLVAGALMNGSQELTHG